MTFSLRRKRFALAFCYGFAGTLCAVAADDAQAQATPLRVDPVLLGLPPIKPGEAPAPASSPVEKPRAEVKPVDPAVVESRPIDTTPERDTQTAEKAGASAKPVVTEKASPKGIPARAAVPQAPVVEAAPVRPSTPVPTPAPVTVAPAPAAPQVSSTSSSKTPETTTATPPAQTPAKAAPALKSETVAASSLEPLRVDPALLGMPSLAASSATPAAAGATGAPALLSDTSPPLVASRGPRDEESIDDPLPAVALRPSRRMEPLSAKSDDPRPTFLMAQRLSGRTDTEMFAEGNAELRKIGTVLVSDRLTYWPIEDEMEAEGNVRLEQGDDVITGPKMRMKIEDQVGFFEQPVYSIKRQPSAQRGDKKDDFGAGGLPQPGSEFSSGFASPQLYNIKPGQLKYDPLKRQRVMTEGRGEAERIDFEGENQIRITQGSYTTCAPGNNDWYVKAASLKLDYDNEVANGKDGTVYFKGVPILHSPWLSFSLNNERKSGFLSPSFGTNSDNGIEFEMPYYWNIAPNLDATITPRVMTKRGTQFNNDFRYMNTAFGGLYNSKLRAEYLPNDRLQDGDNRWGVSFLHQQTTANGFAALINYNKVSDNDYYTDLSSKIAQTSQTQLLQQGVVSYGGGGWWNVTANMQQYQTLQPDPKNPVLEPYRMLPQISFNARSPTSYFADAFLMGQYTNFTRRDQIINGVQDTRPDGKRTVLYPQLTLPYITPGWYVTPKIGANIRHYSLDNQAAGTSSSLSNTLPIVSVDSGMTFERSNTLFGKEYTQTLEPRLYYVYIPYKDQSKIPIFDSGVADFNFAQIFSENQFSGWDRINNANQMTAALTSRLLDPNSGAEIMRAMVGQRLYFSRQRVGLYGDPTNSLDSSDFLAAFSGQILPRVYADTAWQYTPSESRTQRFSVGARYQPEPGKVFNAAYRYNRDPNAPINQVDFSGQWPLSGKLYAVGRLNYSLKDERVFLATQDEGGRMIEAIGGLEYNGGCWVLRGVVQRRALTQDSSSTSFFIQLELNDFARVGSNPLNLLKRNIQGYSLINQPFDNSFNDSF